ncbi:MAG: hypothetical protein QXL94_08690 [Candidatus Parvarchaeum sp.]
MQKIKIDVDENGNFILKKLPKKIVEQIKSKLGNVSYYQKDGFIIITFDKELYIGRHRDYPEDMYN